MHKRLRRFIIGDMIFIGCMLVLSRMLLFAGASLSVAIIPAITLISVALALLLSMIIQHRHTAPQVRRLVQGEYWVHWHYMADVWQQRGSHTHQPAEETTLLAQAGNVVLYTGIAGAAGYFIGALRNPTDQAIQIGLIMGSVVLILSLLAAVNRYRQASIPPSPNPVDVYIGPAGIYLPDRYVALNDRHHALISVQMQQAGDALLLLFETRLHTADRRIVSQSLAVPVPVGCEAEAQELVERFKAHSAQGKIAKVEAET